jgi:hypothetical protein
VGDLGGVTPRRILMTQSNPASRFYSRAERGRLSVNSPRRFSCIKCLMLATGSDWLKR